MRITIIATGFSEESNKLAGVQKAEAAPAPKAEPAKKAEEPKVESAPVKEAPKKPASNDLDLDDLFGDIF
jgi:hypothetical protein